MGNCQATDSATLVLQHPCGKVERFYWPVRAREVMKMNPGHYVALLISTTFYHSNPGNNYKASQSQQTGSNTSTVNPVRLTRIKLLRSTDTLLLGHVYRLITTQEVMKGFYAKKHAKMKKNQESAAEKPYEKAAGQRSEPDTVSKHERQRSRSTTSSNSAARSKTWQPSLQSITEATS
ncbi:nucleobase-ascorbate transporter 6-like isoform X1 [Hibiscus syriacus]|uniref:Nucleobase-ascorbate transporter 6-like isoform X1 n=1 Tax=Hibiscus syriacus TaxID=106335 RepID=A0A6A2ZZZ6_HIBSY|nr:uncharacterized protein LOC120136027 [Hibiscus syriacus]KAE8697313.1 nucleobase-ascorbate transporter 6-like isoform X1 [Hibiscus syriacus]